MLQWLTGFLLGPFFYTLDKYSYNCLLNCPEFDSGDQIETRLASGDGSFWLASSLSFYYIL